MQDPHCHTSSIAVARPAPVVFEIMSDGLKQGQWTWGSFERHEVEPGLFVGKSVFDGKETFVRLNVDRDRLIVDYDVGRSRDKMQFRNMSRVIPGEVIGLGPAHAVVTLMTWRLASQSDAAWAQISCVHEAEMFLIKGLLER
jgi:hypothetical protein